MDEIKENIMRQHMVIPKEDFEKKTCWETCKMLKG